MIKEKNKDLTVGDLRKNQLMLSALKIFCEKGYQGSTINDIVKKAKCSHGLFYHYFKNKKELFDAVCEWRGVCMIDFLDEVLKSNTDYVEKLYKLTEYTFNNMKKDEIFAYRYYFFLSNIFAKAEKNLITKTTPPPLHVKMLDFFEQGIKSEDFSNKYSAKECTRLYNCIIQGATLNFILYPKEFKKDFLFPSIQFIIDIFKKEKNNA